MDETILIIDDDAGTVKLVRAILEGPYRVVAAPDAERGIASARECRPGCIIMDLHLPGMSGVQAARALRSDPELGAIPIVALTAYADAGEAEAIEAGCDAFLTKPIDATGLREHIGRFLRKVRRGAADGDRGGPRGRPRILIVDDDRSVVRYLDARLAREGYDRVLAYGGRDALRVASEQPPDLILLDVLMDDLDGLEVTRRLKRNLRTMHVPVILITALDGAEERLRGLEAGADEFLSKPLNTAELLVRIQSMLRLSRVEEQLAARTRIEGVGGEPGGEGSTDGPARLLVAHGAGAEGEDSSAALRAAGHQVTAARSVAEVEDRLGSGQFDLIVLDVSTGTGAWLEACRRIKNEEAATSASVIVLCGHGEPVERIRALEAGADDVVSLPVEPRELAIRAEHLLARHRYLDGLRRRYADAAVAATTDGLTGLRNATYFREFLEMEVKRSVRQAHPTAVVLLDVDDFKVMNDTYGHVAGDQVLRELGALLRDGVREIDLAARYGGEEFVMVLPYTDRDGALLVAERLRAAVCAHEVRVEGQGSPLSVTISLGAAVCPLDAADSVSLVRMADDMLYRAKRSGKNRVCAPGQP